MRRDDETQMRSYPTHYRGLRFRSRLEAMWAAFFTGVGWPWEYEPFDLDGYIPDFVLRFTPPLLVEVKPAITLEDFTRYAAALDRIGWDQEALLLGIGPYASASWEAPALGWLREAVSDMVIVQGVVRPQSAWCWGEAISFRCQTCHLISLHHAEQSYRCRITGCWDGDHHLGPVGAVVDHVWTGAKNTVQWQPV
jgi:hypothetical protein